MDILSFVPKPAQVEHMMIKKGKYPFCPICNREFQKANKTATEYNKKVIEYKPHKIVIQYHCRCGYTYTYHSL